MSIEKIEQAKAVITKTSAYKVLCDFLDEGSFTSIDTLAKSQDTYAEVVAGYGTVEGLPVYCFAQNKDFCGGAMSKAQAKKIKKIYELAHKTGCPVFGFYDSKGGRLNEGNALLAGYGEVLNIASQLSGVVPQVSVILGSCLGTGALNAVSADFVIMSKDATLSLDVTGKDSDAETNAKKGIANIVTKNAETAIEAARNLVCYLPSNNLSLLPQAESVEPDYKGECICHSVADSGSILKLSKDYGTSVGTCLSRVAGQVVGFVNTKSGILTADDCSKIAKFVRFCDAFSIPVLTFVNIDGFEDIKSASKVTSAYAEATTAKISVVTGKAVGAGYIALAGTCANADIVYALPDSIICPVSPEAVALITKPEIMNVPFAEQEKAVENFAKENLSALNAAEECYVDDVVELNDLRGVVENALEVLMSKRVSTLSKKHSTI